MADNVQLSTNVGTGAVAASDDIGGFHFQRIKLIYGVDGVNSGDVATSNPLPVSTFLGTTSPSVNSGVKDAGTQRIVLATDQPQLTNKLLVTPDSVALPANQSVDVSRVAGTATDTNSGVKSAGTLRVVLATDQPALTNKLLTTPDLPTNASQSVTDESTFTQGTGKVVPAAGLFINSYAALATGQAGINRITQSGDQYTNLNLIAGNNPDLNSGVKGAGTLRVVLATDQPQLTNKLLVTPDSVALPANQSVNVAQINGVATTMGNGASGTGVQRVTLANDSTGVLATVSTVTTVSTLTGGGVAHDGVDSGNPVKVGLKAETSPKGITLVADGDRTDAYADADGLQMVKLNTSGADIISERVSNTDGASTAFANFTAVASTKNYITGITVFRTDAGTTLAFVDFRDGTGGAVLWTMPLPPNGGSTESWATPAFKTSANTALAYDVSAALTTVYINVTGFQSKV